MPRDPTKPRRPAFIEGAAVVECGIGIPIEMKGGLWHTFAAQDDEDSRIWEWDERSGRIVRTVG